MQTWITYTTLPASLAEALMALTDPVAIARWSPFPFEILELDTQRLSAGGFACREVEFVIDVLEARDERLALIAEGSR
jgi:hypothetical protein